MIRDLGQLRAFLAIVQFGSLGRAAEDLYVTQSALTKIIQRLENQVGASLFERTTHGMMLTSYGSAFEPYATLIVAEADNAVRELEAMRGLEKGLIKVGSVASALEGILPAAIDKLLIQWPGLQIRIVEGLADELAILLSKGDIDLAIAFSMPETDELSLVSESGWQEGCHVVAATTHPLRTRGELQLADLMNEKWVMPSKKMGPREEWNTVFLHQGLVPPTVTVETRSVGAMRSLVARCGFLSWMPNLLLAYQGSNELISVLPVTGAHSLRHFAVYRRRRGTISLPTTKLLEELRVVVKELRDINSR
jgi:DNA-binding transcriptional LysR family regulator